MAPKQDFRTTVEHELKQRGWGHRTLARALAGPGAPAVVIENERKSVRRWLLQGTQPHAATRRRVAVALGLPEDTFDDSDDEEEALLEMEESLAVLNSLMGQLRDRIAARHVEKERVA